jgi:hypothetical protein
MSLAKWFDRLVWRIKELAQRNQELRWEAERLRVQLAGCLTAAEGHVPDPPVSQGAYGWSLAYQTTLDLHTEKERLAQRLDALREIVDEEIEFSAPLSDPDVTFGQWERMHKLCRLEEPDVCLRMRELCSAL